MRRRHHVSLLAVAALALGGCGDSKTAPDKDGSTPVVLASDAAAPATGKPVAGTGYVVHAADGWYDIQQGMGADAADSDITLGTTHGSIMNVEQSPTPQGLDRSRLAAFFTRAVIDMGKMMKLAPSTPIEVDGARGLSTKVRLDTDLGVARARVVVLIHGDQSYAIVASSSPKEPTPTTGDFAAMLSSWRWT
jgi:hypothetical protein